MKNIVLCLLILGLCAGCGEKVTNNEELNNTALEEQTPTEETKKEETVEPEVVEKVEEEPTILVTENTSALSNKKIGWYFTRGKDHAQPTFGKDLTVPADKYDAIYLKPENEKINYLIFD